MLSNDPVAIIGVHIPKIARRIPDETVETLTVKAITGALADAGISKEEVNGANINWPEGGGWGSGNWAGMFGHKLNWVVIGGQDIVGARAVANAAAAIQAGLCETVVIAGATAGGRRRSEEVGAWETAAAQSQFTVPFGQDAMSAFALVAQRHMQKFGTKPEHLAEAAATIRNHGHINPEALMYGRGPVTVEDVLSSRMIAEPLHLLDCSVWCHGGAAIVLTSGKRARELRRDPVYVLAGAQEHFWGGWAYPPRYDDVGRLGAERVQRAYEQAGITPNDVDLCCLYDPTSFEVIHQMEFLGFCKEGEGGPFVEGGALSLNGRMPTCTDGGQLSHACGGSMQNNMVIIEAVRQLRGVAGDRQVKDARIALCTNGGSASCRWEMVILGKG